MKQQTVEQRLARLEAIEAIQRLKHDYFFFCDQKRPEQVRDCFVDGPCHIDYGRIGVFTHRDQLIAVFTELACHAHMVEMHHAQNPRIEVLSDTEARAVWSLYYSLIDTRQQQLTQLGGYYEDEYRCVDGQWKIYATVFNATSTLSCALSEGVARVLFAGR